MQIASSARGFSLRPWAAAAAALTVFACQPQPAATPDAEASSTVTEEPNAAPAVPTPEETAQRAAQDGAKTWLALVDSGQFDASWDAAATLFKSSVTKEQWNSSLQGARQPLGEVNARELKGSEYKTQLPGAPDGKYVVVYYESSFAQKQGAKESVTLMQEPDASWKVAGYFIQ